MISCKNLLLSCVALALGSAQPGAGNAATVIRHVVGVYLQSGNTGQTLSDGHTTMESTTISCGYPSGCTLGMKVMSTVGLATCVKQWAIVGLVDGNSVDGGPPVDALPANDITQTRNWQGVYAVAHGSHTVSFQIYVPCAVTAYQWSVSDLVTTP